MKNIINELAVRLLYTLMLMMVFMGQPLQAEEQAALVDTESRQLKGVVLEHLSRDVLNGTNVELSLDGASVAQTTVKKDGRFVFDFPYKEGGVYRLTATKDNYLDEVIDFSLALQKNILPERIEISLAEQDFSFTFRGNILDRDNNEPVPGTKITVINTRSGEMKKLESDYNGDYSFKVVSGYEYDVVIDNRKYLKRYAHINYCSDALKENQKYCFSGFSGPTLDPKGGVTSANIFVDKAEIGKKFSVKNIYYDYNKATLRDDALPNLRKLYHILDDNPQLIVELGSHADSRGSDKYNFDLSQKRAESAVNYVVEQGIANGRIEAKGYGESVLLNQCANGVKCSDVEHAKNRRTEFVIIDIDESVFVD
ncbi:MAG: OmpA family protein [Thiolinea sp.]